MRLKGINPSAAQEYSVSFQSGQGCSNRSIRFIVENPAKHKEFPGTALTLPGEFPKDSVREEARTNGLRHRAGQELGQGH